MREHLIMLLMYLGLFGVLGVVSVISFFQGVKLFEIGLSAQSLNLLIMVLSLVGIVKTLWHMHKI